MFYTLIFIIRQTPFISIFGSIKRDVNISKGMSSKLGHLSIEARAKNVSKIVRTESLDHCLTRGRAVSETCVARRLVRESRLISKA